MHQFNLTFAKAELQESLQAIVSLVSPRLYIIYNDVIAVWPPCKSNRKSKLTGEHGSNFFVSEIIIRPPDPRRRRRLPLGNFRRDHCRSGNPRIKQMSRIKLPSGGVL